MLGLEDFAVFWTLLFIEVVLGLDNVVILAVIVDKLAEEQKRFARALGLFLAYIMRILFVLIALNLKNLQTTVEIGSSTIPVASILFFIGGLFLVVKAISEISQVGHNPQSPKKNSLGFFSAVLQITFVDFVFSFDSVLTAIALTSNTFVIILAISLAIVAMYLTSGFIGSMIKKFERIKLMTLLFVVLVGIYLILEAFHKAFDKNYLFAMIAFCLVYEGLGYAKLANK